MSTASNTFGAAREEVSGAHLQTQALAQTMPQTQTRAQRLAPTGRAADLFGKFLVLLTAPLFVLGYHAAITVLRLTDRGHN